MFILFDFLAFLVQIDLKDFLFKCVLKIKCKNQKYQSFLQISITKLKNTVHSDSHWGFITLSTKAILKNMFVCLELLPQGL